MSAPADPFPIAASRIRWAHLGAFGALGGLVAGGLALVAGAPLVNGDTVQHLVWGRELAHAELDTFGSGPTPHPLPLLAAVGTSLLHDDANFLVTYVLFGLLAIGAVVGLGVEIARRAASPWAGAIAATVLLTSLPILASAQTARYDVLFAALVLAAITVEIGRPRRGLRTLTFLALAGLIRPEAWALAGAYWLWLRPWRLAVRQRIGTAALVAAAPLLWVLMDTLVMGDPLYSLHVTDEGSKVFYGQFSTWENFSEAARNLVAYTGIVPLLLFLPACVIAVRDRSRALAPLLGVFGITLAVFLVFLARGLASSERYLYLPACVLAVLAGYAADGGGKRTPARIMLAVIASTFLVFQGYTRVGTFARIERETSALHARNENVRALVRAPGVAAALRDCRSLAVPSARIVQLFAYYSGRAPEDFRTDAHGRTHPDLYPAPANARVAKEALTRRRFDDDPTFRVPPTLRPGPRNRDWMIYVSPTSACTRGLR